MSHYSYTTQSCHANAEKLHVLSVCTLCGSTFGSNICSWKIFACKTGVGVSHETQFWVSSLFFFFLVIFSFLKLYAVCLIFYFNDDEDKDISVFSFFQGEIMPYNCVVECVWVCVGGGHLCKCVQTWKGMSVCHGKEILIKISVNCMF